MRCFAILALLVLGINEFESAGHQTNKSMDTLPDDIKHRIVLCLGTASRGALKQTNSQNARFVAKAIAHEYPGGLDRIYHQFEWLITTTNITAAQIRNTVVWNPDRMRDIVSIWDYHRDRPFVLSGGSLIDDDSGSYLMVKVVGSISRAQGTMLFIFGEDGYLTSYGYFDGVEWRCHHWSWTYELSKFRGMGDPAVRSKILREWQSRMLMKVQRLIQRQFVVFNLDRVSVSVLRRDINMSSELKFISQRWTLLSLVGSLIGIIASAALIGFYSRPIR